jgi:NADH:ubiquinone oxidoreductase subunit E
MSIENTPKDTCSIASESISRDRLLTAISVAQSYGFEATTEALISLLQEFQSQFSFEDQEAAYF